ncbi:hypothetical protein C6P46_003074 [Rhodotorula mucilaginosa]|uniref:Ataxin-10 homolog n=1 Tax=Rhodotorula mucilaginosa TaxID=5537 RepID=A0A9P6W3A9_RHOMI|nr:hypothetical protein C6P46_003074 [Rhodotorula mucilaginosa]
MTSSESPEALVQLLERYAEDPASSASLVEQLRPFRLALRSTSDLRTAYTAGDEFWPAFARVWKVEADRLAAASSDAEAAIPAIAALAGFTLSLCTHSPQNQTAAVATVEPQLRRVLLEASSFVNLQDPKSMANLVTANPDLAASYFPERLRLEENDKLLQRLLASPDHGTLHAILIFILNSIHGDPERAHLLGTSKAGAEVLDRIMIVVGTMFEDEKADAMTQEHFTSDLFGLSFFIVQQLVRQGAFEAAYEAHALMPGYAISPTLVTLLKFLDGHLSLSAHATSPSSLALVPFLVRQLDHLTNSLIDDNSTQARGRDAADAGTFQGVVLILHCLCSIGLALEQEEEVASEIAPDQVEASEKMVEGIESVVRLLGFAQTLMPPPTARPAPPSADDSPPHPAKDAASARPPPAAAADSSLPPTAPEGTAAIAQLQRTSVQFLGIASFASPSSSTAAAAKRIQARVKAAQDRVRVAAMREHALFTIRNLLKNNQENQDFVEALKPQYRVGQNGELMDLPPALRKS